jgi:hypothetical protein
MCLITIRQYLFQRFFLNTQINNSISIVSKPCSCDCAQNGRRLSNQPEISIVKFLSVHSSLTQSDDRVYLWSWSLRFSRNDLWCLQQSDASKESFWHACNLTAKSKDTVNLLWGLQSHCEFTIETTEK